VCFVDGLTTGGVLAQLLEQWSQRVQFRTKAGPVAGFQLPDSAIVGLSASCARSASGPASPVLAGAPAGGRPGRFP
jgi:hypothetical protein